MGYVRAVLGVHVAAAMLLVVHHAHSEPRDGADATFLPGPIVSPSQASGPAYALDATSRDIPAGPMHCPKFETKRYLGTNLHYSSPIFVHTAFADKLVVFDALVRSVAIEVYGRAPVELHHLGGTLCETLNGQRRFGEHAFGNAIDVDKFTFGPLADGEALPSGLPAALAKGFSVALSWHFFSKTEVGRVHARFLNRLALRLVADRTLFRTVLGPGYGDHWNHFHLDAAPARFVFVLASKEAAQ